LAKITKKEKFASIDKFRQTSRPRFRILGDRERQTLPPFSKVRQSSPPDLRAWTAAPAGRRSCHAVPHDIRPCKSGVYMKEYIL